MNRSIAMFVVGLIFGGGIGFVVAASYGVTLDGHDHDAHAQESAEMHESAEHGHDDPIRLPEGGDAPSVKITVHKDPSSGWNLHVMTHHFRFAPEYASQPHVDGEGHGHVYVNGTKVARVYGPWLHLAALPRGNAQVEVTLNSNDHRPYAIGNVPVSDTVTIEVE